MSCFLFGGFAEDLLKARHRGPRSKTEKDGEARTYEDLYGHC